MAFRYFSRLPIIEYSLDSHKKKKARDILHRLFVDQKFLDTSDYVRKYRVGDGDRPEIISDKLYRRSDIYSIIMLLNNFDTSMLSGLPPQSLIYEEYLGEKYSDNVYYLTPTLSSYEMSSLGGSGGAYVYPIFGRGFDIGERIFGAGSDGFQVYDTRAYVKEWNPIMSSLKLDIISGQFTKGLTLSNSKGEVYFRIAHVKSGLDAVHHFEAKKTTYDGSPKLKGSIIDPLSRCFVSGNTAYYTPMGVFNQTLGFTCAYSGTIVYLYNALGGELPSSLSNFIRVSTNREYEEKEQEKKREIIVPSQEQNLLAEVVETFANLMDSTNTG